MCYIYTISSLKKYDIGDGLNRLIYVGSCKDYKIRFSNHKSDCFNEKNGGYNYKVYRFIRQYGIENFTFEVIEVLDDDTTEHDMKLREQFYIDKYDSKKSMNSQDAILTVDMKEYMRKYNVEYNEKNSEKLKDKRHEKYKKNRDKIKAQNREWINNNKDRFKELQRNLYHKKSLWKKAITELRKIDPTCFE